MARKCHTHRAQTTWTDPEGGVGWLGDPDPSGKSSCYMFPQKYWYRHPSRSNYYCGCNCFSRRSLQPTAKYFAPHPSHGSAHGPNGTRRGKNFIRAWEFVTRSCLKPQNPCSNYEIYVLFEHGFYLKRLKLGPVCMHDVTLESVTAVTDHFADAFVRENVARVYMTLWRRNDVESLTLTPFCFEKSNVRKGIFNV